MRVRFCFKSLLMRARFYLQSRPADVCAVLLKMDDYFVLFTLRFGLESSSASCVHL
jgi:hypothetical protein